MWECVKMTQRTRFYMLLYECISFHVKWFNTKNTILKNTFHAEQSEENFFVSLWNNVKIVKFPVVAGFFIQMSTI